MLLIFPLWFMGWKGLGSVLLFGIDRSVRRGFALVWGKTVERSVDELVLLEAGFFFFFVG